MYLKDDIEYSKDDFYKLSLYFIEDVEINDDIVQYEDGHSIVQYSMSIGRLTGHSIKSQRNVRQIFKHIHAQLQQRDRSGDRQPARGDRVDLGKEIMKAEQYPTMKRVMELMREGLRINIANESRASGNRSTLLPGHEFEASPKCPASPEFHATRDLRSCRLFEGDLKKPRNVRAPQMQALARLLNMGRYRVKGYPAPMEWAFREKLAKYAESKPDLPWRDGAEYAVWGTSLLPVAVVPRTADNTVPKTDHEGVGGVIAIPETHHKNGICGCLELVTNNPVEFTLHLVLADGV